MRDEWTEEQIAAWVDGALEPEEARRIGAIVIEDEAARECARRVAAMNRMLKAAFAETLDAAPPARLTAAVLGAPGKVAALPVRRPVRPWVPAAMAATVALAIGLGSGATLFGGGGDGAPAGATTLASVGPAAPALAAALESAPTGATTPEGLRAVASFRMDDGRVCREFETGDAAAGLACRGAQGDWTVMVIAAAPQTEAAGDGYAPASGVFADALSAALDAMGAGPALGPDEEAAAIADGWR
jgi:hypothetical protein